MLCAFIMILLFGRKVFRLPEVTFQSYGGVAQLGERFAGSEKVAGSIPVVSTILKLVSLKYSRIKLNNLAYTARF